MASRRPKAANYVAEWLRRGGGRGGGGGEFNRLRKGYYIIIDLAYRVLTVV